MGMMMEQQVTLITGGETGEVELKRQRPQKLNGEKQNAGTETQTSHKDGKSNKHGEKTTWRQDLRHDDRNEKQNTNKLKPRPKNANTEQRKWNRYPKSRTKHKGITTIIGTKA